MKRLVSEHEVYVFFLIYIIFCILKYNPIHIWWIARFLFILEWISQKSLCFTYFVYLFIHTFKFSTIIPITLLHILLFWKKFKFCVPKSIHNNIMYRTKNCSEDFNILVGTVIDYQAFSKEFPSRFVATYFYSVLDFRPKFRILVEFVTPSSLSSCTLGRLHKSFCWKCSISEKLCLWQLYWHTAAVCSSIT